MLNRLKSSSNTCSNLLKTWLHFNRVLLLNSQLKPDAEAVIKAVWIEDPSDARLAQWKDVKVDIFNLQWGGFLFLRGHNDFYKNIQSFLCV
jgi:hypothetical protein